MAIAGRHRTYSERYDWLTPPWLIDALTRGGEHPFQLDPCGHINASYTATHVMVRPWGDGLTDPWHGRVWLNPPYWRQTGRWLEKLADHGTGTALIFARTDTEMFHRFVWERADALLFLRGRLVFHRPDGSPASHNAGGPSVLVAYGRDDVRLLAACGIPGAFVSLT